MLHILVADDDKNTRRLLQAVLEPSYTVTTASNGQEALDILDRLHIDLVVLDVMMPEVDGLNFTRQLRDAGCDIPILMISARQLPEDRKQGFLAGTDDYMVKPVDTEELLLRVRALLRRSKITGERRLQVGSLTLDNDQLSVSREGETIYLPAREFQLLFLLLSYPGRIFTRIQLMDQVWGMDSESGWETVTVHVGRLRRRFANWGVFEIQSVRGLGYRAVLLS